MPSTPFFSVVIPLYNKELYIEETLRSVLNQTFDDFEIVIINDGSTDKSLKNAKHVLKSSSNYLIRSQKNKGLSASRNVGISLSKGKIIALLDADDIWHENFLESIYSLYSTFPEASVYGTDYQEKYSKTNIVETKKNLDHNLKNKAFLIEDFFLANKFQSVVCQSSIAFKKEMLSGILFDEIIDYAEDVDFYLKCFITKKLAYNYTVLTTILSNIPNQITRQGIKNKTIPNLDMYESNHPNNRSLKKYLDSKRYAYAIEYKLAKDRLNFDHLIKSLNFNNLNLKQKVLLKSPLFFLKFLKSIKKILLKYNIRITSFSN
ncbi:glycosyltransferase family 2 protein [Winogradskyella haliclonae]|uniref:Glycosyl transferase n=1 Tax=Winogradskyella haliclonae TaxID=2048558 RepID=A0ABQ2BX50_9FLAO|nr:glycosyltransferase family 2 protein [Winogradskyella haliclonae]GGI57030.1 glycosyl transferase [Winogradskyella haliclonae]